MASTLLQNYSIQIRLSAANPRLLMPQTPIFRVSLENFGVSTPTTELTKQVVDVTRPNVSFEDIPVDVYNSQEYISR